MGKYINESKGKVLPALGKAITLINDGAEQIEEPKQFEKGLVCVVNNGMFDAAAYVDTSSTLDAFKRKDGRPRIWLKLSIDHLKRTDLGGEL